MNYVWKWGTLKTEWLETHDRELLLQDRALLFTQLYSPSKSLQELEPQASKLPNYSPSTLQAALQNPTDSN